MAAPPPPARRYKTTLSCAECRRLKLRCDRVFPCSSCQRRGCASICPEGYLLPSKAARKEGPSRIEILKLRVRELEIKLATLQKNSSDTLQTTEDSKSKGSAFDGQQSDENQKLAESLGTLSITGYGKSRFFGITGGTAPWLWNIDEEDSGGRVPAHFQDLDDCRFPPELVLLISAFPAPMPSRASPEVWNWFSQNLPSRKEALRLCETFYDNGAYIFMPLPRTMFTEQIFSYFYGSRKGPLVDIPRGHRLALLLIVFAIADLLDLNKPAIPTGGKRFYFLARAALTLERLYEHPTLTVIQVILLMMMYLNMSDHKESAELVWVLSGINVKLSLMLGLHRDSEKFSVDRAHDLGAPHVPGIEEAELRRIIFLEVVHFEAWQALQFGRPSLLRFEQYDCGRPGGGPERDNIHERGHVRGQSWSYLFLRECLSPVLDYTVCIEPPKYADIVKLDAKIRTFTIPSQLSIYEGQDPNTAVMPSRASVMLHFSAYSMKEVALLYLHRSCFVSAMNGYSDPLSSPFGLSVIAAHQSASTVVTKISMLYEREPGLSVRIYLFWSQLFVSCILGALVVRCPSCTLAPSALIQLDAACKLFEKAREGVRPAAVLSQVLRLRDKAHTASRLYRAGRTETQVTRQTIDVSAELSALGGTSRPRIGEVHTSSKPVAKPAQQVTWSIAPFPAEVPKPGDAQEEVLHTKSKESSLPAQISSYPAGSFPQEEQQFDWVTSEPHDTAFPGDILPSEGLIQPESVEDSDLDAFAAVNVDSWLNFMAQMGFNS